MISKNIIYVQYFWKYAKKEEIEDMLFLSIPMIGEYIIELWKHYYDTYKSWNESLLAKISLEKVNS